MIHIKNEPHVADLMRRKATPRDAGQTTMESLERQKQ